MGTWELTNILAQTEPHLVAHEHSDLGLVIRYQKRKSVNFTLSELAGFDFERAIWNVPYKESDKTWSSNFHLINVR